MPKLTLPFTKADDTDPGEVDAVTTVEGTIPIASAGFYKIAAMGTSLLWKLGAVAVTAATGSYLKDGDQEIIFVPAAAATLRHIRSADSTADGEINLVPVQIIEIPGREGRNYTFPT